MLELEDTLAEVLKTDLSSLSFSHTPFSEAKHEARALKEKKWKGGGGSPKLSAQHFWSAVVVHGMGVGRVEQLFEYAQDALGRSL